LAVGNFFGSRGTWQYCHELVAQLEGRGHSVIRTSTRVSRPLRLLDMVATVLRRRGDYDLAHVDVFSGPSFLWAQAVVAVLRRIGKPVVATLHGGALPQYAQRHPDRVRRLLAGVEAVTAPSRYLQEALSGFREDIRFLPNAIDLRLYRSRPAGSFQPRIVWLRGFHQIYRPQDAPKVLTEVRRVLGDATLTMVGPDKDGTLEATRRVADENGVADAVTFSGRIEKRDVPRVLAEHCVFLNTTSVDNTPVSVVEAMATGLCIVSTDVGGLPYLLENGRDALMTHPGDIAGMASAVVRFVEEPRLAERMAIRARLKAEGFDWTRVLPCWEELFREVLAGPCQVPANSEGIREFVD